MVYHPGSLGHGIRTINPVAPAAPTVFPVEGQVRRPQQEVSAGRPGPLREGLPQGAYWGYGLVLLRARRNNHLPTRPLDRRTGDQRRLIRGLGALRMQS